MYKLILYKIYGSLKCTLKTLIYVKVLNIQSVRIKYHKYIYGHKIGKDFLNQIPQEATKKDKLWYILYRLKTSAQKIYHIVKRWATEDICNLHNRSVITSPKNIIMCYKFERKI